MKGITVPYKDSIRKKRLPNMVLIKLRCGGVVMIFLLLVCQSAMALLHGYPLGLFDHPKWTSQVRAE